MQFVNFRFSHTFDVTSYAFVYCTDVASIYATIFVNCRFLTRNVKRNLIVLTHVNIHTRFYGPTYPNDGIGKLGQLSVTKTLQYFGAKTKRLSYDATKKLKS